MNQPIVGIVIDERLIDKHPTYLVLAKYIEPLIKFARTTPILIPPICKASIIENYLSLIDGLLLTGSPSDIHPSNYGHEIKNPDSFFDNNRDETSFSLIRGAIRLGLPVLGICRGFQEINVALGGTLHQSIHRTPQYMDHREKKGESIDVQYGKQHSVTADPNGKLIKIVNRERWDVNSLHDQGIDILAPDLQIEARADDGLIEAVSLKSEDKFVLGAQWHFEWKTHSDPNSLAIFNAFGAACKKYKNT